MIQFNLLPDVKLQYIKARRLKRLVIVASVLISGVSLAVFIFLLVLVDFAQKKSISDLSNTINKDTSQIQGTPNLNALLTVQNQLEALPTLHENKPVVSRLFGFIAQTTPITLTLSDIQVDFATNTIVFSGGADTLATVNTFVDTLKYSTYSTTTTPATASGPKAFPSVVLTGFSYESATGATFNVTASYNPDLFSEAYDTTITVPPETTTRATLGLPIPTFSSPASTSTSSPSTTTTNTTTSTTGGGQ